MLIKSPVIYFIGMPPCTKIASMSAFPAVAHVEEDSVPGKYVENLEVINALTESAATRRLTTLLVCVLSSLS
jgi:hypothetical protein